jgi:DNA-binding transcriptional MocR family regulator
MDPTNFRKGAGVEIHIDRSSRVPIYRQIVDRLREMILSGSLPPGFRLPPERRLAETLEVNRSTVLSAYRELKGDGLVTAHVGRGTVVMAPPRVSVDEGRIGTLPWRQLIRDEARRARDPLLRDLLEMAERTDVISLSIGLPAPELVPMETTREILDRLLTEMGPALLMHCPTEGLTGFRETLSRWLTGRGIMCGPSEVLVLSGSQQGLDLVARVLLEPGDIVVVEEPTYIGALEVFRAAQARLIGVPCGPNGLDTEVMQRVLERHRPKLIYTLPTFQNPSGAVLDLEGRRRLLELAYRYQVPIVEDDPYSDLRYEGEALPSLRALDDKGYTLYLSTFSKLLYPGLRVGFMVAPRTAMRQLVLAKQSVDLHANTPGQALVDAMIREDHLQTQIERARRAYTERRDAMHRALIDAAVPGVEWSVPAGGFYIWCKLPENTERVRLPTRAVENGVAFLPGWSCFADDPGSTHVRLNFTYPSIAEIRQGIPRLMAAVEASGAARRNAAAPAGTPAIV